MRYIEYCIVIGYRCGSSLESVTQAKHERIASRPSGFSPITMTWHDGLMKRFHQGQ